MKASGTENTVLRVRAVQTDGKRYNPVNHGVSMKKLDESPYMVNLLKPHPTENNAFELLIDADTLIESLEDAGLYDTVAANFRVSGNDLVYDRVKPDGTIIQAGVAISGLFSAESDTFYGSGVPDNGTGNDGDEYLDTTSGIIYQKESGVWVVKKDLNTLDNQIASEVPFDPAGTAFDPGSTDVDKALKEAGDRVQDLETFETSATAELSDHETRIADVEAIQLMPSVVPASLNVVFIKNRTYRVFYDSIFWNWKDYDLRVSGDGVKYPRFYEVTYTTSGSKTITFSVYNDNNQIATVALSISVIDEPFSPISNKNILFVGDSLTYGGQHVGETKRMVTGTGGTPEGLALSNVSFVGGKEADPTFEAYTGKDWDWFTTKATELYENTDESTKSFTNESSTFSGWGSEIVLPSEITFNSIVFPFRSWDSSVTQIRVRIRNGGYDQAILVEKLSTFISYGTNLMYVHFGQMITLSGTVWFEYLTNGHCGLKKGITASTAIRFTTSGDVNGSVGSASGNIQQIPVAFLESSPFVLPNGVFDFSAWESRNGLANVNYVYILLGWNSITFSTTAADKKASAEALISGLKAGDPNVKIRLLGLSTPSKTGLHIYIDDDSAYGNWIRLRKLSIEINAAYKEIADADASVEYIETGLNFDYEYAYSTTTLTNIRITVNEVIQNNGVHPSTNGYYLFSDMILPKLLQDIST